MFRTFQILFYALRPGFVRTQELTQWHFINLAVQLVVDYLLVTTYGVRPLIYLLASSFFAGSLHPLAGHFIAEHYLWDGLDQETYSYYGPLNVLAYNVRFHPSYTFKVTDASCTSNRLVIITSIMTSLQSLGRVSQHYALSHQSFTTPFHRTLHGLWSLLTLSGIQKLGSLLE